MSERSFTVTHHIGSGGFAWVFLANELQADGSSQQRVLKRLLPSHLYDKDRLRSFVDEGELGMLLNHPYIGKVYDLIDWNGCPTIVLEHVDGPDFKGLLKWCRSQRLRLSPAAAVHGVACVAEALAYAWTAPGADGDPLNVIHRDLKPENIMLSSDGIPRLMDFGIARFTDHTNTRTGMIKGTIPYMSPELASGLSPITPASDVFSLGSVLFEFLTGLRLFAVTDQLACLNLVAQADYGDRLDRLPQDAQCVRSLLTEMLHPTAEMRIPNAAILASRLRAVQPELPGFGTEQQELATLVLKKGPSTVQSVRAEHLADGPLEGLPWRGRGRITRVYLQKLEDEAEVDLPEPSPSIVTGPVPPGPGFGDSDNNKESSNRGTAVPPIPGPIPRATPDHRRQRVGLFASAFLMCVLIAFSGDGHIASSAVHSLENNSSVTPLAQNPEPVSRPYEVNVPPVQALVQNQSELTQGLSIYGKPALSAPPIAHVATGGLRMGTLGGTVGKSGGPPSDANGHAPSKRQRSLNRAAVQGGPRTSDGSPDPVAPPSAKPGAVDAMAGAPAANPVQVAMIPLPPKSSQADDQLPKTGVVTISSDPWGDASLDGAAWAPFPRKQQLSAGTHTVRIRANGKEYPFTFDVQPGKVQSWHWNLKTGAVEP